MARWIYTEEHIEYVRSIADNRYNEEIAEMFNSKFGVDKTASQIQAMKRNYGITSGDVMKRHRPENKLFTDEQEAFLKENLRMMPNLELTELVNKEFALEIKPRQIMSWKKNNGFTSGLTGHFEKGRKTWNKGMKGLNTGGEAGWFKKGNVPANYVPVGTERVNGEGYTDIKVAEPNVWKTKHRIMWEKVNGAVPESHVLLFGDGDKSNIELDNLLLISRSQLAILNTKNLIQSDINLTKVGVTIADLHLAISIRKDVNP